MCNTSLLFLVRIKKSVVDALYRIPTSLLALLLIFLLTFNALSIFSVHVTIPTRAGKWPQHSSTATTVMYSLKEENSPPILMTHLPILKNHSLPPSEKEKEKEKNRRKIPLLLHQLRLQKGKGLFAAKVNGFFGNSSSCKVRFFMTWIGSLGLFGERELFALDSLFKTHPHHGCLVIVSNSMDSARGNEILSPYRDKGNRVISISPDYDYLFKNNPAQYWHNNLLKGTVDPGEVPFGQNLSNLLRLALLYKFGGVYLDTDIIVLKSFLKLRNVIGAQTMDVETSNWSRLNNAVLVFDKKHPLVFKFIQEFALTFDGNKWGHNGPYLVSRVVSRVRGRPGFNFTVLPRYVFYPIDWRRVGGLFRGPRGQVHSKWIVSKYRQISRESYALHLWNRQSRNIVVEEGSIVGRIMSDVCNKTRSDL